MPLSINLGSLSSRIVRTTLAGSTGGVRRFALDGSSSATSGNVIHQIWDGFARFAGFVVGKVIGLLFQGVAFSFTAIWSFLVSTFNFVWNFNWNATDAQLDADIKQGFVQLAGSLGGTIGNALGYLVCGALPGIALVSFNEPLGLYVLEELGEEAADEIAGNLANLIKQTGAQLVKMGMAWLYKNTRAFFRSGAQYVVDKLVGLGVLTRDNINKAKASRDQPWSFAIGFENLIESIPNPILQNFVEEFFDEFSDACIESGYIIAASLDSYFAAHRIASVNFFGGTETLEIYPNRSLIVPTAPTPPATGSGSSSP